MSDVPLLEFESLELFRLFAIVFNIGSLMLVSTWVKDAMKDSGLDML